jgi:predicted DNA-binding transcriptional regulator AlpA
METQRIKIALPSSLPPRGLARVAAAAYVGVSPCTFDQLVAERRMPKPKRIGRRCVWDRLALDIAFTELPTEDGEPAPQSRGEPVFAL